MFFTVFHQMRYKKYFGMIRTGSDADVRINRNSSDWLGMNFNPILSPGYVSKFLFFRILIWHNFHNIKTSFNVIFIYPNYHLTSFLYFRITISYNFHFTELSCYRIIKNFDSLYLNFARLFFGCELLIFKFTINVFWICSFIWI